MTTKSAKFFKVALIIFLNLIIIGIFSKFMFVDSYQVLSKVGSRGSEVTAIQQALKDRGLFNSDITGYYGSITQTAVKKFQQQKGLVVDGIAGPNTLRALGVSIGSVPKATEANINLLARIISAEARLSVRWF